MDEDPPQQDRERRRRSLPRAALRRGLTGHAASAGDREPVLQVLIHYSGLVEHGPFIEQDRDLAISVKLQKLLGSYVHLQAS